MTRLALVMSLAAALGCSPTKASHEDGQNAGADATPSTPQTLALQTVDDLPACGDGNQNQLVYIISQQEFQVCAGGAWAAIDIKGKDGADGVSGKDGADGEDGGDGIAIAAIWTYLDDSFALEENVSEGAEPHFVGDIRLVEFSDGTQFVTVNGQSLVEDSVDDLANNDFTHSFFLAKDKTTESMKVSAYANVIAYYLVGTLNGSRTLSMTIDIDGDLNNNTLTRFTLVKSFPTN